jgi:hypothetical protein
MKQFTLKSSLGRILGALATVAVLAAPTIASAVPIIDFAGQAGGNVVVNGDEASGGGISISHVQGTDTPLNSGPQFAVTNGSLNFDTLAGVRWHRPSAGQHPEPYDYANRVWYCLYRIGFGQQASSPS